MPFESETKQLRRSVVKRLMPFWAQTRSMIFKILGKAAKSAVGKKWWGVWMLKPPTRRQDKRPSIQVSVSLVERMVCSPKSQMRSAPSVQSSPKRWPQKRTLLKRSPKRQQTRRWNLRAWVRLPLAQQKVKKTKVGTRYQKSGSRLRRRGTTKTLRRRLRGWMRTKKRMRRSSVQRGLAGLFRRKQAKGSRAAASQSSSVLGQMWWLRACITCHSLWVNPVTTKKYLKQFSLWCTKLWPTPTIPISRNELSPANRYAWQDGSGSRSDAAVSARLVSSSPRMISACTLDCFSDCTSETESSFSISRLTVRQRPSSAKVKRATEFLVSPTWYFWRVSRAFFSLR